jgi:hypothetical protein
MATAAVRAGSWLVYRGMANAAARDAQAEYIDAPIEAWLNSNLPQNPLPPRVDLQQRFDDLASKEADEFWATVLALFIEGLRH